MSSKSNDSTTSNDPSLTEWQAARDILDKFDERLHDLRKVGFSFITGLLTADTLFTIEASGSWRLAALVATLFLIVPLDLVDRNYRVFQSAAAIRAQILERRNRMDLTQMIARMVETAHVGYFFEAVYVVFALAVLLLGWIVLPTTISSPAYWLIFLVVSICTVFAVWFSYWLKDWGWGVWFNPFRKWCYSTAIVLLPIPILALFWFLLKPAPSQPLHYHLTLIFAVMIAVAAILYVETSVRITEWVDFGIDKYEYEQGEEVQVTISNMGYKPLTLKKGEIWKVHNENRCTVDYQPEGAVLPALELSRASPIWADHRWLIPTKSLPLGLYRVVYYGPVYRKEWRKVGPFKVFSPGYALQEQSKLGAGYYPWYQAAQRFRVTPKKEKADGGVHQGSWNIQRMS
jgi:hypothetical protein